MSLTVSQDNYLPETYLKKGNKNESVPQCNELIINVYFFNI